MKVSKTFVSLLFCSDTYKKKSYFVVIEILADMLEELQEHVESIDMANGKFVNVYSVIFIHFLKFHGVRCLYLPHFPLLIV